MAPDFSAVTESALHSALEGMILSPSGWRGVFCASGNEEDRGGELAPPLGLIAAAGAAVFAAYLFRRTGAGVRAGVTGVTMEESAARRVSAPTVILGRDTRPTGEAAADLMIRAFLASGCAVRYTGITAAPEIMAYARTVPGGGNSISTVGFCYISASHNPIGHNGFKFGLDDGGVLEGAEANTLIADLKRFLEKDDPPGRILALLEGAGEEAVRTVHAESAAVKNEALAAYRTFSGEVISGAAAGTDRAAAVNAAITEGLAAHPLGIAADFNGSARTLSIDRELFRSAGTGFYALNETPGGIVHAIIPEGPSLDPCRRFLEKVRRQDPSAAVGYVPDCDGDRGNLVIWDEGSGGGAARTLEAQEVFALSCMAELAQLVWTGELSWDAEGRPRTKTAVAVNGPTSMRIDRIAAAFGAETFRAEVGEANVVNLARRLRREGYLVRILGEGSNGGNITHPSSVRDPLATVFALVKLLAIRGPAGAGFFDIWRQRAAEASAEKNATHHAEKNNGHSGGTNAGKTAGGFTLGDIIASLPVFYTTPVAAPEAQLAVRTKDHALLKEKYQRIFLREWEAQKDSLQKRWGITGWEARACVGTEERRNLARFGDAETGGLKIVFKDSGGGERAFIWMRGSKTEPVFRIMADAEGSAELERELVAWQRAMTAGADAE